jgi:hypothetical protein
MSAFSGDKSFPVKTYKSDMFNEDGLKYRCYIVMLPVMEELSYIDFVGEFDNGVNRQISDILSTETGNITNNMIVLSEMMEKEDEDLDYLLIFYMKEYSHTYKQSILVCKEEHLKYCQKFNDVGIAVKIFYNNIDKFNEVLDITGHFHGRRLTFSLTNNENMKVDKDEVNKIISRLVMFDDI